MIMKGKKEKEEKKIVTNVCIYIIYKVRYIFLYMYNMHTRVFFIRLLR